ncbi:helix-turn-helix domain-containing protein [Bradyrhizobium diazoefficiens]|nr:helix-turn-helix domain-containing protein [Bradyrhizobium diazoefficiens]MBR0966688.1 helix-turn-helix domain-containing protein [Bradyrhizobium diazoefficiens]MBR0980200.1 helix-turn-helix domain-containing protein [Bradyrhizobium diazoefficiens]MBR1009548.1 helix-turn-helix domain-containing protein [Bradyrhizobium diazoefficiens]MBR1016131.1 helix-turn-helix domain-containing protein [Bradyrhizobium diazoefficiens]MBR1053509.1 helix-turn-helix domain-containing protein [Bradyrhizobium d
MDQTADNSIAFIDCYRAEFPADDPQGASSYARMLAHVFDFEIPSSAVAVPFSAVTEIFSLTDVTVSWTSSTASRFTRTTQTIAAHGTDQILVVCYTHGSFTMTIAGRTTRVEAGELAFIDLSQEIVIEAPTVENVSLAVSRRKLEPMVPFLDDAHGFVRGHGPLASVLRDMMKDVTKMGPTIPVVDARAMSAAIIQLAAACLEPLSRQQADAGPGRSTVSLVAIKAFVEQRLSDPELRPQTLLDEFGITRSTLYRLFEPLGGVSAYITKRKLQYAFRLVTDTLQPPQRISQLAYDLGFSHLSVFTRAFKELFGLSPTEARSLAVQSKEREIQLAAPDGVMKYVKPITLSQSAPP